MPKQKEKLLLTSLGLYLYGLMESGVVATEVHDRIKKDALKIMSDTGMMKEIIHAYQSL